MTVEFGPRDGSESVFARVYGLSVQAAVSALNYAGDDVRFRYDTAKASLALTGESEHSGDAYRRGQVVFAILTVAALLPLVPLLGALSAMDFAAALGGTVAAAPVAVIGLLIWLFSLLNLVGFHKVAGQVSVVDHTTDPAPDALDDIKERYQNGEIDEEELEREAAEVWER